MAISDTFQDLNVFNGVGVILTLFAVLLFLIFLAYSLSYLKQLSAKIIYLIRVASKVTFQKHKKRQSKKKAKYGVTGAGKGDNGPDSDEQAPKDQFYQELKNNWKKEIYNDRVGKFKSLFYSILAKYNYQLFCCCKVKRFNTLNQYDLLKPNPNFQWMLFASSLGTLWYVSVFLTATLHIITQYDARDLADLFFLFYVLVISAVASPCIIFIIWALWRYYNKTVSHAMTTGNEISKKQRQGIYYDFMGGQDSLIGLGEFELNQNQIEMIQESRNGSVNLSNNLKYSNSNYNRATINFPNNQDQKRFFEEEQGSGSDRILMASHNRTQKGPSTFHYSGFSNQAINKSAVSAMRNQSLSKIDQQKFPLSRSSRESRPTLANYGPFATDRHFTPQNSVHSAQHNSYANHYRNSRKQTNHLRVSQYSHNINNSQNLLRNSMPSRFRSKSSAKFPQPRRYTTVDRTGGGSIYAASDNLQAQTLNNIDTGNNILWKNPVLRMKGYFSRLNSPHSCKDATWYGIGAIILFGMTVVACFLCLILQRNLALYVLFLFIGSFLVDMLIIRNFYLFIIALFHFCFYRHKRNAIQRKYRFRYSEMVRIQQARNLEFDQAQLGGIYRKISGQSQDEQMYSQKAALMERSGDSKFRKSTIGRSKQSNYLDYPDKLQRVKQQENQDGGIMSSSYGPCGDQKRRAWITSPDRDDKIKNIIGAERRMTQLRKNRNTVTSRQKPQAKNRQEEFDEQQPQQLQQEQDGNRKDSKVIFATPGAKNGYSPINRLQSQEQFTERDGFSRSSPLRILDLMSSKRKNESGPNQKDENVQRVSGVKDNGYSPARHDAKERWANSPKKKPYYLNNGQLVKVFSPGDGAQSFDHPGDDQMDTEENQELNRKRVDLKDDDDLQLKKMNGHKQYRSSQDLSQGARGDGDADEDQMGNNDSEKKLREVQQQKDPNKYESDSQDNQQQGLNQNEMVGSGQPKPKDNNQDSVNDEQADYGQKDQSQSPKLIKKIRSQDPNNGQNQDEGENDDADDDNDGDDDQASIHAKSLDTNIARGGQIQQDQLKQNTKASRMANMTQKGLSEQDQNQYKKRAKNYKKHDDDDDDDSDNDDDDNDNDSDYDSDEDKNEDETSRENSSQYSKQGIILANKDQVLSYDRRSTLPLQEIYGTQNPVNELNDMNLILLDQIFDAFGDGTQEVLKSFKNNHLYLPKQEDDLTEIVEESQIITQQEQEESQEEEEDDKSEPRIRVLEQNKPLKQQIEKQHLNQDGTEMLEILQKLDFWRQGDYPLIDDMSPYQLQQIKRDQFLDRPLSLMSQKIGLKVAQPVVQESSQQQEQSQLMFRIQSAQGEQNMLSDQQLKLEQPNVLVSDTQEDGQRLDYFSMTTDPCQRSNDQVSSRFGGENRQLPIRLDRLRQSKGSRLVQEGDGYQSQLDAVERLKSDSQLEGSLRMTSEKLFRGNVGGEVQINDGISRPLKDIRQSRHIGPGKNGMQDSSLGVNPLSVRLENEELPIGQEENEQDSKAESTKIQQGLMIDDEQIRNRKKIRPPRLLELTQKERQNRPIEGLPLIDGQNQLVDELENNDSKIHDERNQFGEEIQNQIEEDIYLNDGDHLPSQLLEANFPTPVPQEHIKHPNSLTKSFYRSKSPNTTKRDTGSKFYEAESPKSPYNNTRSDFSGSKRLGGSKQGGQQVRIKAQEDPRSAQSLTKSEFSGPLNKEQQIKMDDDADDDPRSVNNLPRYEFSGSQKFGSPKAPQQQDQGYRIEDPKSGESLTRSELSGPNNFAASRQQIQNNGQDLKRPKNPTDSESSGYPNQDELLKSNKIKDPKSTKNLSKSDKSGSKTSKLPKQQPNSNGKLDLKIIKAPSIQDNQSLHKSHSINQPIIKVKDSEEQDPRNNKYQTNSELSGPKNYSPHLAPRQFMINNADSDQISRNSSIIEHEQVKFDHQVNDAQTSDMDQLQGNQRTQYSINDPKRQIKSRPKLNQMRQTERSQFQIENSNGDNSMLPPRSTGGQFFGSPANRSRYPQNFNGRFTTDFKSRNPDDQNNGTQRNNYINQTEPDLIMKGTPQIMSRPGKNRVESSIIKDPKQLSYPRQMISNKNPQITTDNQSPAFKIINQGRGPNFIRTHQQDGFGGPAGLGYYIPRGRSRGMYDSDGENQSVTDRRDSRNYQRSSSGRGSGRGSARENGRISDPLNRQYEPQFGGTAFTRTTKSKRTGGGYKYESSTSFHPPDLQQFDSRSNLTARANISTSQPPVIQSNKFDQNDQFGIPPRPSAKEKNRNWKKKSKKKSRVQSTNSQNQKQQMASNPYQDVSVQSKFMQSHYKHEIRASLRKQREFRHSIQNEESPNHPNKKRYQPSFPTNTRDTIKQLINRVPQSLKQIKKQKKKRELKTQYVIDNQAMRKIKMYGDDQMMLNVSRMREQNRNSFFTGNESDLVDGEHNRRQNFHPRSTPRKSDDPDTLILQYNPTSRHLQP